MASERELTRRLARFFGAPRDARVGIGDDAAVVRASSPDAVVCCDPVIEGVHFTAGDPQHLVGRKAVNRNLSDLAAMGALPDHLVVSLILPRGCPAPRRHAILVGIRSAAAKADCHVVGGDVATADGPLVVTVTAIGHLAHDRPLVRSGARAGDTIHVTGPLGGSRAGGHLRFRPALREGAWLAGQACVRAAMDVSDGLLLDLATLLEASGGRGAVLRAAAVPITAAASRLARGARPRALRHALEDGEDHVLLWTQAADQPLSSGGPIGKRARRPIGVVTAEAGLWVEARDGSRQRVEPAGYLHRLD